jgi:type IV pilus assembly protein PilV
MRISTRTRRQAGFSLVEVAVAAAIFSLGVGGMSLVLLMSMHGTHLPRSSTFAALHAHTLAETLRALPDADPLALDVSNGGVSCGLDAGCPVDEMAMALMESWQGQIERDIPTGRGLVCRDSTPFGARDTALPCDGSGPRVVTVHWTVPGPDGDAGAGGHFTLDLPAR